MQWGLLVLLIVWAVPGFGADEKGVFTAYGEGFSSCGAYASAYEKDLRERPSAKMGTFKFAPFSEWIPHPSFRQRPPATR